MATPFNFYELKAADRLPSPAGTALAIMQLVQQENVSLAQLAKVIQSDPALTSRILSFSNSATFGLRRPVASIVDAVRIIGMQAVQNFALSLSLLSQHRNGRCASFDYENYWMLSLAMAVSIAALTAKEQIVAPEEAFCIGLLEEIGQLALATAWPDKFADCLEKSQGKKLLEQERHYFAIDHRSLTLMLLKEWGMPEIFLDALKLSHDMPKAEVSRTVRFANQLAFARELARYCIGDQRYQADALPALQKEAVSRNFRSTDLLKLLEDISRQWQEWGKQLQIKTDGQEIKTAFSPPSPKPEAEHEAEDSLAGLAILLVNNDPALLTHISKHLSAAGHKVETAADGETALRCLLEQKQQLVIIDWRMQPMDGLTLCKTLRRSELGKSLYLIMLTPSATEDELVSAFEAGVDDFIVKPVNARILLARIRAGQRIISLQQLLKKEKEAIQRYNAELALANRRLGIIANTDILTNLPNRRYAMIRLEQEWSETQRYQRPFSVLILDIDYFKAINDSLGHEAGDKALVYAAKLIKNSIRATDTACRFGGEEFLVIAPNTDGKTAMLLAERIRNAIYTHQPKQLNLLRPMTVSIGIAGAARSISHWKELIKCADQALYKAKAEGRNNSQLSEFE